MLADADRSSLNDLFSNVGVQTAIRQPPKTSWSIAQWEAATRLYTRTVYALLREGRAAQTLNDPVLANFDIDSQNFGSGRTGAAISSSAPATSISATTPGAIPTASSPDPGRPATAPTSSASSRKPMAPTDCPAAPTTPMRSASPPLTWKPASWRSSATRPPRQDRLPSGLRPAPICSPARASYNPGAVYGSIPADNSNDGFNTEFYEAQDPEFTGGGDDINNWDSNRTWERFYN